MSLPLFQAFFILAITVSISEADYEFTVRFYEFRNPLGLQCGECESGGLPACCDDVQRTENCTNVSPFACDTRFRFTLRPFGEALDTAPTGRFPYFTPSNNGNSDTFNEGRGGFLALSNPFTITSTNEWTGRIQFFIDALDKAVQSGETEIIINRFPINLVLELGANVTERMTYTGIYNISGIEFDMSFRVQCSENYYGPNCTTFCQSEGVYTCDSEGRRICVLGREIATNCTTCLPGYDPSSNCTRCLTGRDVTTNCTACLPGYDPSTNCIQCLTGRDASTYCSQCLTNRDIRTSCTTCLPGYDPQTNCTECLPNIQCQPTQTTSSTTITSNAVVTPAILGGVLGLSVMISVILIIVVVVLVTKSRGTCWSTLPLPPNDGDGGKGTMNIEMKPNSHYGLTNDSIVTKPNEVYGVLVPAELSQSVTYEYVNP